MGIREIIFRGKRIDTGEWVYGLPFAYQAVLDVEGIETWDGEKHRIDPLTVGQYTGLTDRNGKKIFEGDIVRCVSDATEHVFVVVWDPEEFGFKATNGKTNYGSSFVYLGNCEEIEIISNLHDNLQ